MSDEEPEPELVLKAPKKVKEKREKEQKVIVEDDDCESLF
jgi:hypothetical protein